MDLKDFVEQTLVQIIEGVQAAQDKTRLTHGYVDQRDVVNPRLMERADNAPKGKYYMTQLGEVAQMVKFDVAITTDRSSEAKAGAGIRIAGVGFGGDVSGVDRDSTVSRISFEVPLAFPRSENAK